MLPSRDGIGTPRFGGASELYAQGDSNPCSLRGRLLYRQADGQELFHKSPLPFWLMRQCDVAVRSLILQLFVLVFQIGVFQLTQQACS